MSFPLTVTVTSMQTPVQFCLNNLRNKESLSSSTLLTSTASTTSSSSSSSSTILSNHQHGHNHPHHHHQQHLQQDSRYSEDHHSQLMLRSFVASSNATNQPQFNNSDNNNNNQHQHHSHYKTRKMMITPSPPPSIIPIGGGGGGDDPDLVQCATLRSNNLNPGSTSTIHPIQRKQSVFVAPSGLSSIREHHGTIGITTTTTTQAGTMTKSVSATTSKPSPTQFSEEDFSERIAKLIQNNKEIMEAAPNLVQTSPLFNRRSSMSSQQQQQQPLPPPPPQYPLTAPPLRRYSSSMERSQRNQSNNVILQTGDLHHPSSKQPQNLAPPLNSSSSVPYSKLQSALLGDSYSNTANHHPHHHPHQTNQPTFPSFAINPPPRTSGSPNYSDHQRAHQPNPHPISQIPPLHHTINANHLLNMRKYSEHLLPTWANAHHANPLGFGEYLLGPTQPQPPPPPSVVDRRNETSTSSSSILFPSLYQQHSSSSTSQMFQTESTSAGLQLSVIINPSSGGSVRANNNTDQQSDPKSCLVRNLLLNSQKRFPCSDDQCCSNMIGGNGHCHIHCGDGNPNNSKTGHSKLAGLSSQTDCLHNNGGLTGSGSGSEQNQNSQQQAQSCIIKDLLLKSSSKTSLNGGGGGDDARSSTATVDPGNSQETPTNNNNSLLTISESHLPPRKRSRVHNNSNSDNGNATSDTTLRNNNGTNQSDPKQQISTHPHHVHTCELCLVKFQHEQNLEIHQQYYCSGQKTRSGQSSQSLHQTATESAVVPEETKQQQITTTQQLQPSQSSNRERKVSVLERPSIITYTNSVLEPTKVINIAQPHQQANRFSHTDRPALMVDQNHRSRRCSSTSSSYSSAIETGINSANGSAKETATTKYDFGNILKSKLLAGHHHHHHGESSMNFEGDDEDEEEDETYECLRHPKSDQKQGQQPTQSFKKRKISEPAFRYYSNPYCEATVKQHRTSILQQKSTTTNSTNNAGVGSGVFSANQNYSPLEIIPAYMPCLMRPNTKITIKGPNLLPVLQRMIDMGTNHEFILDNNDEDYQQQNDDYCVYMKNEQTTIQSRQRFLVKQEQEILIEQEINQLMNDILVELEQNWNIGQCLSDMIDVVAQDRKIVSTTTTTTTTLPQRPTTLALQADKTTAMMKIKKEPEYDDDDGSYDQRSELPEDHHRRRKISVLVNQCSWIQNDFNAIRKRTGNSGIDRIQQHQLIPSTLVSPDTPRPKRKYQQLFLNGNAYSNLGLKVSLRPTYCCIYRLQPMFVMQEANPQLSMYSQWTTHPIPEGDVLKIIKSPEKLLSAYNSQEAVFVHNNRSCGKRHQQQQQATPLEMYAERDSIGIVQAKAEPEESIASVGEFLRKIKLKFFSKHENDDDGNDSGTNHQSDASRTRTLSLLDRCLKSLILTNGQGLMDRVVDQSTRTNLFLTPSNYQQLAASFKQHNSKSIRTNQNSSSSSNSNYNNLKYPQRYRLFSESSIDNSDKNMGLSSQQTETALCNSVTTTCCSETIKLDRRKRSSGLSSIYNIAPTLNSSVSAPSFCLNPVPMFQPESPESEQSILYIMMLSQSQPSLSVPSVEQIMSTANKNLAFRKFSDCIGLRQQNNGNNVYDQEHGWRFGGGNQDVNCDPSSASFMPKRIKIFEGGFKSNEDYTYIRGRGRGKYMCGECGIRCKKPSMLKKHIRTHTDLRPYSCRYCAFAFKTKGNLTKHMKSKAHHKKCVEMNIIPVPISIDDSQIDMDALNKQEQYELNCNDGSNGVGGVNGGHDDEYDDDEMDEEEEDDEGVPIPVMQQSKRLTYIEPGQFDDADDSNGGGSDIKRKLSESAMKISTKTTRSLSSSATIVPTIRITPTSINATNAMVSNNDDKNIVFDPTQSSNQSIKAPIENQCSNVTISLINDNNQRVLQESPLLKTNDNLLVDENDTNTVVPLASSNHHQPIIIKTSISSIKTSHMIENDPKKNLLMISSNTNHHQQVQTTATAKMDSIRKTCSPLSPSSSYHNRGCSPIQQNNVQQQSSTTNSDLKSPLLANHSLSNKTIRTTISSSSLAKQSQDENEAEAARSLLILSSGTNPINHHHNVKHPHHLDGSPSVPGSRTTSTTIVPGTEMVYVPEIYGHDSALLKQTYLNPHQPQSSIESMVAGKTIPIPPQLNQNYSRQQPPAPVHHPKSRPTSVIIANHQSLINNHQKQLHCEQSNIVDIEPTINHRKKRVRTISNCSNNSSGSGDYGIQQPPSLKKLTTTSTSPTIQPKSSNTNLHSVTTMIASTSPTLINTNSGSPHPMIMVTNHPHLMDNNLNGAASASTQQKLLQKIYSNQQQQRTTPTMPIGFRTATPPMTSGSKFVKEDLILSNPPQQHPPIRMMGSSASSSSSSNTFCPPLPTIVEQSLSRYVANNSAAQAAAAAASTRSTDQDQPIDLSSKKSLSPAPKLLQSQEILPQQTQTSKTSSPTIESTSSSNKRNNNLIKNYDHRLSEQIVRQFSGFDNTAVGGVGFNPLLMGDNQERRDLYQSVRSEEFAHSMPGVRTPHSISKAIPHVWMMNNNGFVKESTSNNSSLVGERLSPSKTSPSSNPNTNAGAIQDGGGKPTCPTCMRQFSKPEQLTLHIRIHSFERLFRCEPCRISFRTKGHLQKHTRSLSHTNKLSMNITFGRPSMDNPRPFKCVDCKSAFRIHGHLAKHLRSKLHIMKLECLGKVPFGMYAEMERNDINFGSIDTTDCDRALETLQLLAQKLYDPRQKCWMENVDLEQIKKEQNILNNNHNIKDLNNHPISPNIADEDSDWAPLNEDDMIEILEDDDCSSSDGVQSAITSVAQSAPSSQDHHDGGKLSEKVNPTNPDPVASVTASSNSATLTTSQTALTTGTTIVSTRSNTCHICGRLFKAAKFLQVHLYCEHPDWNETTSTTTTTTTSATISNSTLATSA